jgi:hypothetical protein
MTVLSRSSSFLVFGERVDAVLGDEDAVKR